MGNGFAALSGVVLKTGIIVLVMNEIRGLVMVGPVLYGVYQAGGSWMAIWIGFCSLLGIVLSIVVPLCIAKRLKRVRSPA